MKQLRGGFSLLELDVVDSTNEYLKRQGGQLPDKTVVMAHRQTAGKGRLGRSWQSEPGESLTVSWLFCSLEPQQLQWLPLAAGWRCINRWKASWDSKPGCLSNGPMTWLAGRRTAASKAGGHPVRKPQWGALLGGVRHRDKPMSAGILF